MKQIDFDRAFPQTPDCISAAIEMGIRKGQKKMKLQNKIIAMGSIAAALMIMFAATLASGGLSIGPKPDVMAQPPISDIPKATEEPMVWCTEKGAYYHSEEHCSGMEGAIYGTLSYALALDKSSCPVCIAVNEEGLANNDENITVYAAYGNARYYHKAQVCNGQENKRELTLADANMENLDPCPDCYGAPFAEENAEETDVVFYCTPSGKYYHLEPDCSGMRNAEARTPEQVFINSGYTACPSCIDTDEEKALLMLPVPQDDTDEVFIAPSNNYYHRDHGCFYMSMVIKADLKTAKDMGHTPCPMCFRDQVDISTFEICWATKNGIYYHSDEHCSGMENAVSGLVEEARSKGKMRCPVCMKTTPENYDLFTTAFGQEIEDLYHGYIYEYTNYGYEWNISNGTECFRLCDVHPQGTAFFGEELPGLPELHLHGLTADPEQVHVFMKNAPGPIGSMYAAAPAEVERLAYKGNLTAEEVQLQQVKVYFDANRQVSSCEMQFGFYDHVKLAWKVGADGQIEMTQSELVRPGWDDSSEETPEETTDEVIVSATSASSIDANLSFLGTITQKDRLYQAAFGNLEEVLAAGYGFIPEIAENYWMLTNGQQTILSVNYQDTGSDSALEAKWIFKVILNNGREINNRFMESIRNYPMASIYPMAIDAARDHMKEIHPRNAEALDPYVEAILLEFDESYQIKNCRIQFPCAMHALYVEFQPKKEEDGGQSWDIKTYTKTT